MSKGQDGTGYVPYPARETNHSDSIFGRLWPVRASLLIDKEIPGSQYLKQSPLIWGISFIINLAGLILPLLILQVYDRIIPKASINTLIFMVAGFIGFIAVEFILRTARAYIMGYNVAKFQMIASQEGAHLMANQPFDKYSKLKPQKHAERLRSIMRLGDFFGSQNCLLLLDLPFVLLFVGVMGMIGGWIAVVPIVILAFFALLTVTNGKKLYDLHARRQNEDIKSNEFISECMRSIASLKGFAMEGVMTRRFERLQRTKTKVNFDMMKLSHYNLVTYGILGSATVIAVVTVGAVEASFNYMSIGSLAACTLLAGRIVQPIVRFAGLWSEFQTLKLHLDDVIDMFKDRTVSNIAIADPTSKAPSLRVADIVLDIPSVGTIGPFNFEAKSNTIINLSGQQQRTKTLFLQALGGMVGRAQGQVYLNDTPIDQYRLGNAFGLVYVGPETEVFAGTILENLTLFNKIATIEDVRYAVELNKLNEDINRLSQGYETPLGGSGSESITDNLVRRIVLARAMAMRPKVLILDEPQTLLDGRSQLAVLNALTQLKEHTTIVMSSKASNFQAIADEHITLSDNLSPSSFIQSA